MTTEQTPLEWLRASCICGPVESCEYCRAADEMERLKRSYDLMSNERDQWFREIAKLEAKVTSYQRIVKAEYAKREALDDEVAQLSFSNSHNVMAITVLTAERDKLKELLRRARGSVLLRMCMPEYEGAGASILCREIDEALK